MHVRHIPTLLTEECDAAALDVVVCLQWDDFETMQLYVRKFTFQIVRQLYQFQSSK